MTANRQTARIRSSTGSQFTRREALGAAAALATVVLVPRHVLGGEGQTAPSDKPVLAGIGVGGVGYGQMQACEQAGFHVAALCDVDDVYAKKAFDRWPDARRYRDFREMLDAEGSKIDAVYCGTPDHTHAIITLAALRMKKHVCCVKPLTHTIEEYRLVMKTAREAGVATQVTASPNTSEGACRTCELIWSGAIGAVREVTYLVESAAVAAGHAATARTGPGARCARLGPVDRTGARCGRSSTNWPDSHLTLQQVKAGRPRPAVYHPWNFRGWWDFGTGALGDMGCHHVNTPYRALEVKVPHYRLRVGHAGLRRNGPAGVCGHLRLPGPRGHAAGASRVV